MKEESMRALVWHGKEDIRCDTVTDPEIEQPRDAIVSEDDARKWLELFAARGVVAQTPDGRFRYGPASADVDALVRILERAYNERPVTLIQMIYALRDAKIRSFADAFKFRKS